MFKAMEVRAADLEQVVAAQREEIRELSERLLLSESEEHLAAKISQEREYHHTIEEEEENLRKNIAQSVVFENTSSALEKIGGEASVGCLKHLPNTVSLWKNISITGKSSSNTNSKNNHGKLLPENVLASFKSARELVNATIQNVLLLRSNNSKSCSNHTYLDNDNNNGSSSSSKCNGNNSDASVRLTPRGV